MSFESLFVRPARSPGEPLGARLRAAWRLVLFLVVIFASGVVGRFVAISIFHLKPPVGITPLVLAIGEPIQFALTALAIWIMARIEHRPFGTYGLPTRGAFGRLFWVGSLWGLLSVVALIGLIMMSGGLTIDGLAVHGMAALHYTLLWAVGFVAVGLYEELYFRGYALFTLSTGMGFWLSAILLSIDFAAEHYFGKPMENLTDAASVGLIGLFLCLTLRRTGSLWFAVGFHFAFDWAALFVFGAPNTGNQGLPLEGHLLNVSYRGPAWLTGGPLGIEASALVFVVIAALFLLFNARYRERRWPAEERGKPAG